MRHQNASKLHNGDEVTVKNTDEIKIVDYVKSVGRPNKYGYYVEIYTTDQCVYRNAEVA